MYLLYLHVGGNRKRLDEAERPMKRFSFISVFLLPLFLIINTSFALPLSTNSRWIVDDGYQGRGVKLTCVNWPSHLEAAVAEGLNKQPLDINVAQVQQQKKPQVHH